MNRLLVIMTAACLSAACTGHADSPVPAAAPASPASACVPNGQFHVELYGAVRTRLDWTAHELRCEGMPRPEDAGARLRFAGAVSFDNSMHKLAFIVALPDLEPGATGNELPATITLIEEDNGRFFSSADADTCWADVYSQQALPAFAQSFEIRGIAYCVAPLAALNGTDSVTFRDMEFTGRVDWQRAE